MKSGSKKSEASSAWEFSSVEVSNDTSTEEELIVKRQILEDDFAKVNRNSQVINSVYKQTAKGNRLWCAGVCVDRSFKRYMSSNKLIKLYRDLL